MGTLSGIDLAVLFGVVALAVGTGSVLGRKAATTRAWLVGERDIPWWAVLLSIVATETSVATFVSVPGLAYTSNLGFLQLAFGYVIGRFLVARWLLPRYFEGDVITSYEVLGRRFGPGVKQVSSLLFLVTRNLADGLRLFGAALPLHKLTGWPLPVSIAAMGAIAVAYTFAGGVRAVVWTDVVQFFVYAAGGALALCVAVDGVSGGLGGVLDVARANGKLALFDTSWTLRSDSNLWAGLIGGTFLTLATHGTDQLMVQRYLCARSRRDASIALISSGFVVFLQFAFFLLIGLALFAWFREHAPMQAIGRGDDAFPQFIAQGLVTLPGAAGLVLGAVLVATLSSSLNASAAALVNDWIKPAIARGGRGWSDARTLRVTRLSTIAFALAQVAAGIAGAALAESVVKSVLAIASFTTGLTLGLFFLARLLPRADEGSQGSDTALRQGRVATVAFLAMLAVMLVILLTTRLAWPWYAVVGSLGTLALGSIGWRFVRRLAPRA